MCSGLKTASLPSPLPHQARHETGSGTLSTEPKITRIQVPNFSYSVLLYIAPLVVPTFSIKPFLVS